MKCKECNHNLAEDAKFCNYCGAEVKEQENQCEKCNHELTKDDKFCAKCGEKVHKEEYVQGPEKGQIENSPSVSSKKGKSKSVILTIAGVVVLAAIVFLVFNMKDSNGGEVVHKGNDIDDEDSIDDYSLDGLAEHYSIDEDLLTYEEMIEVVEKIEAEYEDEIRDLGNEDRSMYISEKIEEEYGEWNADAYSRGLLITNDMSDNDKQQVIAALLGRITYKYISNPINGAYQMDEKNRGTTAYDLLGKSRRFQYEDEEEFKMIGDTEGYLNINEINLGYPTMSLEAGGQLEDTEGSDIDVFINFMGLITEDTSPEDLYTLILESLEVTINGNKVRDYVPQDMIEDFEEVGVDEFVEESGVEKYPKNIYEPLFGVYLPIEEVIEGYTENGESFSEVEEKLKSGEYKAKIDLEGNEIEFEYPEEDFTLNPEVMGSN